MGEAASRRFSETFFKEISPQRRQGEKKDREVKGS